MTNKEKQTIAECQQFIADLKRAAKLHEQVIDNINEQIFRHRLLIATIDQKNGVDVTDDDYDPDTSQRHKSAAIVTGFKKMPDIVSISKKWD